jgi:predicted ATP-dependent endonuclease of OLD family
LRRIEKLFALYWQQERVTVAVSVIQDQLLVTVKDLETGAYSELSSHSDGFRSFLALVAFAASRSRREVAPVLLIDEAELHLHYDAQASLVDMLHRQDLASKVIYSTHSAGCLPEDLGAGVRQIRPTSSTTSDVVNGIWADTVGVQPLLLALGARSFALGALRRALFVEGPSDSILLPTLMREALGASSLGFQIVPGLAWLRADAVEGLERDVGAAAYLVDGDDSGREIASLLADNGVPTNRILNLGGRERALQLEDLVKPAALSAAVDSLISLLGASAPKITSEELAGAESAAGHLSAWLEEHKPRGLSKPLIAQQLVRLKGGGDEEFRSLLAPERRQLVKKLVQRVQALVGAEGDPTRAAGIDR